MSQPVVPSITEPWSRALCPFCGRFGDRDQAVYAEDRGTVKVTHRHADHVWIVSWVLDKQEGQSVR